MKTVQIPQTTTVSTSKGNAQVSVDINLKQKSLSKTKENNLFEQYIIFISYKYYQQQSVISSTQ
jgi:hypothetical protein